MPVAWWQRNKKHIYTFIDPNQNKIAKMKITLFQTLHGNPVLWKVKILTEAITESYLLCVPPPPHHFQLDIKLVYQSWHPLRHHVTVLLHGPKLHNSAGCIVVIAIPDHLAPYFRSHDPAFFHLLITFVCILEASMYSKGMALNLNILTSPSITTSKPKYLLWFMTDIWWKAFVES